MLQNKSSLKSYFIRTVIIIYLITSLTALFLIYLSLDQKVEKQGIKFSKQYLLKEKNRIVNPIQREIILTQKMVDTPILKNWAQNENNQRLKEMAVAELENFRKHFQDKSYFFIIDESQHYYFNNKKNEYENNQLRYTLDKDKEKDQWYFSTMKNVENYDLNVNLDQVLNTTKLWINAIIYNENQEKIGMAGTGLTLDSFLRNFLKSDSPYITPVLFDQKGFVQAYKDSDYIKMASISSDFSQEDDKTIFELLNLQQEKKLKSMMEKLTEDSQQVQTLKLNINDNDRIAALTYIPELNWYLTILLDTSEIFSIWDFTPLLAILIISLLTIVLIIIYFINKIVINPIHRLTDFTDIIAEGNYGKRIELNSNNELGRLAESFNDMAATIQKHTENLEEMVEQRTQELTETNNTLESKNKKLMDNLNYAEYIQNSILPASEKFENKLEQNFIIWEPRDEVGGDFYWFKEKNNHLLLAVVDCTGHGVPGALMTMTANSILDRIVDKDSINDPSLILKKLNNVLKDTLHQNNDDLERDDGLDIGLCSLDLEKEKLTFSGAKISLYYGENEINLIKGDRHSIGYQRSQRDYNFTNHEIDIKNQSFYMTTDGLLDQNGGPENKRWGRSKFIKLLEENSELDLKSQKQVMEKELKEFMNNQEQRDDITVIGFKA